MESGSYPSALSGLSGTLHKQFGDWLERRKPQEEEMLRAYQDNMRIARDDDTKDVGTSKAQKSKIFIGSTRSKIRSARAKIKDALFSGGAFPFDTKPSNEKLKAFADTVEEILSYQLEEGEARKVLSTGVGTLALYGTGFIFGPFVKTKNYTTVEPSEAGLKEVSQEYDCPYYEHARTMDVYPDPEAEDVRQGNGIYWASRKQPEFIKSLKGQPGYSGEAIDRAVQEKVSSYTDQGSDRTDSARMNLYRYTREGRVWFVRYFGLVTKRELAQWKAEAGNAGEASSDDDERVEAIVIMAGGQVIKAEENPYKEKKRPVRRCVYEDVEHEMWGVGVAKNNDPHQRVTNAAFRLFIEGKAYALLKMCSVDRSKFELTEDFKFFPGKRFLMKPNLTPEERKEAIIWHDTQDVTEGWESVIALSEKFSDDDTAITKYTEGNDGDHLNKTATGISMIMNASSLPLKEVLSNIDEMWIEDMVESLLDWNMDHLEPETVRMLLGEKQAEIWRQVKEYGKTNFMEWFATGSQTFMAKEVLMHKLQGFLQIVAANEHLSQYVDLRELLQQVWDAGQMSKESPVFDEETLKKNQGAGPQAEAMKAIQDIEHKAGELIRKAQDEAKEAKRMEASKIEETRSKDEQARRTHELAMMDRLGKFQELGEKSHALEAQIDKLQAETLEILARAGVLPSPELQAKGTEAEGSKEGAAEKAAPAKSSPLEKLAEMHTKTFEKLGEMHGQTLQGIGELVKAQKVPKEIVINPKTGRKRLQPVEAE